MDKLKITIDLVLLPEDFRTLTETAGREGMTTAELLEAFIADLTHGSDTKSPARQWLRRCGFRRKNNNQSSFLTWLIDTGNHGDYETYRSKLNYYSKYGAAGDELQGAREGLDHLYTEYCKDYRPIQEKVGSVPNCR